MQKKREILLIIYSIKYKLNFKQLVVANFTQGIFLLFRAMHVA